MRRPPRFVLKQPNRANVAIAAEIEPMPGAARHANQVARFDFDRDDRPAAFARMDMKQAPAPDDEPYLVLVVPVLGAELREHRLEVGGRRGDVDDVGRDVAAPRFQLIDFRRVRSQDRFRWRVRGRALGQRPALEK